jgi:hypothetical protein
VSQDDSSSERHAGSEVAIASNGDYLVDTTEAESGHHRFRLKNTARLTIEIDGTEALEVYKDGPSIRIDLGAGAKERVVLGDALIGLLNEFFQQKYDVHTHPTSVGPTGPPLPLFTGSYVTDDYLSDLVSVKKS